MLSPKNPEVPNAVNDDEGSPKMAKVVKNKSMNYLSIVTRYQLYERGKRQDDENCNDRSLEDQNGNM